jgi:hypothetical protein
MTMNRPTMPYFLVGLAAFSSCGSWSNRDLEFAAALPSRQELRSKLPVTTSTSQGLSSRRDGLNVGDPSKAYADAQTATKTFNGILDFFLSALDQVRQVAPSARTQDTRTWGPYTDQNNSGFSVQVKVQQLSAKDFSWVIQAISSTNTIDVLTGSIEAAGSIKASKGTMTVHIASFRDQLQIDDGLKKLDAITIDYATQAYPLTVKMVFSDSSGPVVDYAYLENEDTSGQMTFLVTSTDPRILKLGAVARWTAAGAGKTVSSVEEGTSQGFNVAECWDPSFKVTYYSESWAGGQTSGLATDCPTL